MAMRSPEALFADQQNQSSKATIMPCFSRGSRNSSTVTVLEYMLQST